MLDNKSLNLIQTITDRSRQGYIAAGNDNRYMHGRRTYNKGTVFYNNEYRSGDYWSRDDSPCKACYTKDNQCFNFIEDVNHIEIRYVETRDALELVRDYGTPDIHCARSSAISSPLSWFYRRLPSRTTLRQPGTTREKIAAGVEKFDQKVKEDEEAAAMAKLEEERKKLVVQTIKQAGKEKELPVREKTAGGDDDMH